MAITQRYTCKVLATSYSVSCETSPIHLKKLVSGSSCSAHVSSSAEQSMLYNSSKQTNKKIKFSLKETTDSFTSIDNPSWLSNSIRHMAFEPAPQLLMNFLSLQWNRNRNWSEPSCLQLPSKEGTALFHLQGDLSSKLRQPFYQPPFPC